MTTISQKPARRGTLRDLKTAVSARIRSKPTIEGQRYLDLYVLQRDRFRWLRLIEQSQRSIQAIDMALRKIGFIPGERDVMFAAPPAAASMASESKTSSRQGLKARKSAAARFGQKLTASRFQNKSAARRAQAA